MTLSSSPTPESSDVSAEWLLKETELRTLYNELYRQLERVYGTGTTYFEALEKLTAPYLENFPRKILSTCLAWHIFTGSTPIYHLITQLDLTGEASIEDFMKTQIERLKAIQNLAP